MTLKQRLLDRIENEGPIPFEDFMEEALYSDLGFFGVSAELRSTARGDFLTSPEVSPMFGRTLAELIRREHERIGDPFVLVEAAAGSGSLLGPLLETYPTKAVAVERSPAAIERLGEVVDVVRTMPETVRGVIVANELIDNLPMALAQLVEGSWRERWVGRDDDSLVFVDAPPRPPVLAWLERYAGDVMEGGWVEVQLAALSWVEETWRSLEAGALVLIDYGDTADNLTLRRQDGTLRTYRAHHLGPHPLDEPGETDITADVNFTPLVEAVGGDLVRQDDFLSSLGLRGWLSEMRGAELEAARQGDTDRRLHVRDERSRVETLLHPRGLGDFRVLIARR